MNLYIPPPNTERPAPFCLKEIHDTVDRQTSDSAGILPQISSEILAFLLLTFQRLFNLCEEKINFQATSLE